MTTATQVPPTTRSAPALIGLQHLGLTVRDVVASEAWYTKVLGLVRAFVEPHGAGDGYAVVMTRPGTGLFMGLDHHPDGASGRGESHPPALSEPGVNLSIHPAPIIQPPVSIWPANGRTTSANVA